MKKVFTIFLALVMMFSLIACGKAEKKAPEKEDEVIADNNGKFNPDFLNQTPTHSVAGADEAAVAAIVSSPFAEGFVGGLEKQTEGLAKATISARGTEVVIAMEYTTMSTEMLKNADVEGMINQMFDTAKLLETFRASEPAISKLTLEVYSNEGELVGSGSRA